MAWLLFANTNFTPQIYFFQRSSHHSLHIRSLKKPSYGVPLGFPFSSIGECSQRLSCLALISTDCHDTMPTIKEEDWRGRIKNHHIQTHPEFLFVLAPSVLQPPTPSQKISFCWTLEYIPLYRNQKITPSSQTLAQPRHLLKAFVNNINWRWKVLSHIVVSCSSPPTPQSLCPRDHHAVF
jgi:hypothetical protein